MFEVAKAAGFERPELVGGYFTTPRLVIFFFLISGMVLSPLLFEKA